MTAPRFSIVTPVFDPPADVLRECVASVRGQTFGGWELCLVDDGSTQPYVRTILDEEARSDARIRLRHRAANGGIVAASNEGVAMASGQFVVLLDHDDLLTPDALACVDEVLRADDVIDYVYSDEDKVTVNGVLYDEFCKPDWSPERLRCQNYLCHLSAVRASLLRDLGGFREGFDGSQDYDLLLRVTERARHIHHIRRTLYHWRALPGSAAADPVAKPKAFDAARRALEEHCARVGLHAEVVETDSHYFRISRRIADPPLVSIIIPTRGTFRPLRGADTCLVVNAVASVCERSSYERFELVVVADTVTDPDVLCELERTTNRPLTIVPFDKEFNFSSKINLGSVHAAGDVLVLLNDDVEVISTDWLETMVGLAIEADVGMVGPLLRFADGSIQAAGHVHDRGVHNLAQNLPGDTVGPFGLLRVTRECMGVTAACAALRTELFERAGGLNVDLPNSFNDVDLGLKLRHLGYRNIWTPFAELYHFESMSRDPTVQPADHALLNCRWGYELLNHDPYGSDPFHPARRTRRSRSMGCSIRSALRTTQLRVAGWKAQARRAPG